MRASDCAFLCFRRHFILWVSLSKPLNGGMHLLIWTTEHKLELYIHLATVCKLYALLFQLCLSAVVDVVLMGF